MTRSEPESLRREECRPAGEAPPRRDHARITRILLGTDGSECAHAAVRLVSSFRPGKGVSVRVVSVTQPLLLTSPEWFRIAQDEWACGVLHAAVTALRAAGLEATSFLRSGSPAEEILREARDTEAELVVLGSHGRSGLEEFLLGSIARNVAQHAEIPVLIARGPCNSLSRIVLALDESVHSAEAAAFLARLPLAEGAAVTAVHVCHPYDPFPGIAPTDPAAFRREVHAEQERRYAGGERLLQEGLAKLAGTGWSREMLVAEGDPSTEILRLAAKLEADLIVAGARGVSGLHRLLVGSVADRLLHSSPRSLLLVR